jgi:salicylate 5-hydroxylase small subunit
MMGIDYKVRDAVEALNLKYIRALDRRDMHGWLATFDNPGAYICIPKENEDRGLPIGYMLDDSYARLKDRVTQVTQIQADAVEHYQPRHFTQLVDIQPLGGVNYRVETHFTVNYTPANTGRTEVLASGTYVDEVIVNGEARFRCRKAVLDTNVVPRYVAYPI